VPSTSAPPPLSPPPSAAPSSAVAAPSPSSTAIDSSSPSASGGEVVAHLADILPHHALSVTDPVTGDPAVLFRLASGQVVGYDALCTHEGCPVEFDSGSELLVCPCHGAVFDPAHQARVLAGPTRQALLELPLSVDPATGAISITA
jgi:Rieske Fe-S protein